jgi:hypothetical protein
LWIEKLCSHLNVRGYIALTLTDGEPPIYVGIYVDDIIYFSASDVVEKKVESLLSTIGQVEFMGQFSQFLGIEFTWKWRMDGHLSVSLTQQSFAETLIESLGFDSASVSTFTTTYQLGLPIDSVPHQNMPPVDRDTL